MYLYMPGIWYYFLCLKLTFPISILIKFVIYKVLIFQMACYCYIPVAAFYIFHTDYIQENFYLPRLKVIKFTNFDHQY